MPLLTLCLLTTLNATDLPTRSDLAAWGRATLAAIERDLHNPYNGLYCDEAYLDGRRSGPAFAWGVGVMHSALNAAARLEPAYRAPLTAYAAAIERYWNPAGPVPGFDVLPLPKPVDRYYDDNAWLVLTYAETADLIGDTRWRDRAEATMAFVLSGEDDQLGGGIYWREEPKASKNTCVNAPAAVAAYTLYRQTGQEAYRAAGDRLLTWTLTHLRDPEDGLMWDNVNLEGQVERTKWSYNTALTIRALADPCRDAAGLADAARMAEAALARWQDPATGAFKDGAAFAHLLAEALLELDTRLGHERFRPAVLRALAWLHAHHRDDHDHYGERWDQPADGLWARFRLIDQASAARAYLLAAQL